MSTFRAELTPSAHLSANGNAVFKAPAWQPHSRFCVYAYGTFGSGTITVDVSLDGTNWVTAGAANLTTSGVLTFDLLAMYVRVKIAGATSPSVDVKIVF